MLTIIATPIGNLKDITLRSLDALNGCDGIICEDSRRALTLLEHYEIKKPLLVLNDFNEASEFPQVIDKLNMGSNLCLISDAGTPLISDPGFKLVRECLAQGIEVDSLPGPSSVITALILSGLPPDKFMFLGYPPDKPGHRNQLYSKIKEVSDLLPTTFILFIAPFKLVKTFTEVKEALGDVEIVLAKELTKIHQKVEKKLISDWLETFKKHNPKGEYIALFRI